MKQLKNPNRKQKIELVRQKLKIDTWKIERDDGRTMVIVSKKGQVRKLRWGA